VRFSLRSLDNLPVGLLGELMIRSLKMLVLPLVAGCMVASVCALGEAGSGMGRTAAWTLGLFFATTCIAASLGVVLAVLVQPGHNGDLSVPGEPTYSVVCLDSASRSEFWSLLESAAAGSIFAPAQHAGVSSICAPSNVV